MYYYRKNDDGKWKVCKLGDEEVLKLQSVTVSLCLKLLHKIKTKAKSVGLTIEPPEVAVILQKVAPTFSELANDHIEEMLEREKGSSPPSS